MPGKVTLDGKRWNNHKREQPAVSYKTDEEEDMNRKKMMVVAIALVVAMGAFGLTAAKAAQDRTHGSRRNFDGQMFGPGGPQGRGGGRFAFRGLDLTDAQKEQVKAIQQKSFETSKPYREQLRAIHEEMKAATANGAYNEEAVRAIAARASQVQVEMQVIGLRTKSEIYNILTAEQKAKLAEFEGKRSERQQKRRGPAKNN